ncbi:MAG: hypothetical protein UW70_C0044G0025 [Candidatus Peregrinibacteria bacterium GW2011_GWA2_44_7]|nr:MAG: hypothetical protein UW70_C0044G0025 [Candidatus Peregrinibacteria bacterium GW2011_GWA2_44_7]
MPMFRRFFSRVSALLLVVLLSLASLTTVWAATDTKAPGYVENVKAVPADGEVHPAPGKPPLKIWITIRPIILR